MVVIFLNDLIGVTGALLSKYDLCSTSTGLQILYSTVNIQLVEPGFEYTVFNDDGRINIQ